jgi:hypothetical protein
MLRLFMARLSRAGRFVVKAELSWLGSAEREIALSRRKNAYDPSQIRFFIQKSRANRVAAP